MYIKMALFVTLTTRYKFYSKKVQLFSTFVSIFDIIVADNSWMDEDHFKKFPYCGKMANENPSNAGPSTGRIVNSEASQESYRWVVRIINSNLGTDKKMHRFKCSGTVITDR